MRIEKNDTNAILKLVVERIIKDRNANLTRPLRLKRFLDRYIQSRSDLRASTVYLQKLTAQYLLKFFGNDLRIDEITRSKASDWRTDLTHGYLRPEKNGEALAETSVCIHVRNSRTIFNYALKDDLIKFNPFDRLRSNAPEPDKDWKYVTMSELDMLLEACPNTGWAQKYPQYTVSNWIGHGIKVSARHYLQIPKELYDKVTDFGITEKK